MAKSKSFVPRMSSMGSLLNRGGTTKGTGSKAEADEKNTFTLVKRPSIVDTSCPVDIGNQL